MFANTFANFHSGHFRMFFILRESVLLLMTDTDKYDYITFPGRDIWGVVMAASHPLAGKKAITVDDLIGEPLFSSEQSWEREIKEWAGEHAGELHLEQASNFYPYR